MRRITRFAPARCLGMIGFKSALQRLSMALMLVMLTSTTAWALEPEIILTNNASQYVYRGNANQVKPAVMRVIYGDDEIDPRECKIIYGSNNYVGVNAGSVTVTLPESYREFQVVKLFDITKAPLTVTAGSASKYYDGTPLTCNSFTLDGIVGHDTDGGYSPTVTVTGSQTKVGASTNVPSAFSLFGLEANYDITYVPGTLTVTPNPADWEETNANEYTIHTADGWGVFCDMLEGNAAGYFTGKTVMLGDDITVTRMAGSGGGQALADSDRPFSGTFLGQGHTLTFNYGTADTPSNEDYIAPFRYVSDATISGLHVSGNIYTSHVHAGGIIGLTYGTSSVTDCHSSVNIVSSINGDGTHGGILACTWTGSTTNIEGCLFDGSIQSAQGFATDRCGGFIGWRNNTVNVTNSLLTADLSTIGVGENYPSCTFVRNGVTNITNSYYTEALGTVQGKQAHTIAAGEGVSVAHAGVATTYDVSGITAYKATAQSTTFMAGLLYNNVIYAGSGDEVSLTLANTPPEGYGFDSYTVSPDGATLSGSDNPYTLTMPASNVTVTATWAQSQSNLGNCWHEPEAAEPTGTYMRNPIHPYASSGVNIYTGNQFQGDGGNPGDQIGGTIYYRAEGASAWNRVAMEYDTEIEDNKYWRGTIPANESAEASTVEYVIEVIYNDHDPTYLGLAAAGDVASTVFGTLEEAAAHPFSFTYVTPNPVSYIDENGNEQTLQPDDYTVLTGGGATTLSEGWYVVNSTVKYAGTVTLNGNVNLILGDGCTMNIGTEQSRITSGPCINADGKSLTVYGQTNQTGALKAYNGKDFSNAIAVKNYTQHGGKVIIDHSNGLALYLDGDLTLTRGTLDAKISAYAAAIALGNGHTATVSGGTLNANGANSGYAISGNLTVSGGTVNATCDGSATIISGNLSMTGGTVNVTKDYKYGNAIEGTLTFSGGNLTANGTIDGNATLGWTSPDDRITATTYDGTVTIAAGQAFTDGQGNIYRGTLTQEERKDIAGMTLVPSVITLAAKQVTVDGRTDYWTTFYSGDAGYGIDAEENACAYTATYEVVNEVGTITLHKLGKVIPKGTAVIIVGADASISMTTSTAAAENTVSNHLHGVDVATLLSTVKSTYTANTILVLSNKNQHFGFHELATTNVPARKAFLALSGETAKAREFMMVFDDATGIHSIDNGQLIMDNEAGAWYSLDGRRLSGKPTQKGLYIHNGRKEVLK